MAALSVCRQDRPRALAGLSLYDVIASSLADGRPGC
jgi:hypothetical protein